MHILFKIRLVVYNVGLDLTVAKNNSAHDPSYAILDI